MNAGKTGIEGSTGALSVHGLPFPLAASPSPLLSSTSKAAQGGPFAFPQGQTALCAPASETTAMT